MPPQNTSASKSAPLSNEQLADWNDLNATLKKARIDFSKVPADDAEEMDRHYRLIQDIKAKRDAAAKPQKTVPIVALKKIPLETKPIVTLRKADLPDEEE